MEELAGENDEAGTKISTLYWILFALMCVSNITMTILFYKHESELDRQDAKIDELLELHGMLPLTKAKRHIHSG